MVEPTCQASNSATPRYLHFEDRLLLLIAQLPTDWGCCRRAKRLRLSKIPMPWPMRLALDGFWAPLMPLTPQQAAEALAQLDRHAQRVRRSETARAEELVGEERFKLHLLYPWAAQLPGEFKSLRFFVGKRVYIYIYAFLMINNDLHILPGG